MAELADSPRRCKPGSPCNHKARPSMRSAGQLPCGWTDTRRWTPASWWSRGPRRELGSTESRSCRRPLHLDNRSGENQGNSVSSPLVCIYFSPGCDLTICMKVSIRWCLFYGNNDMFLIKQAYLFIPGESRKIGCNKKKNIPQSLRQTCQPP